jgi:outer membrane biosynthesis protein TonB
MSRLARISFTVLTLSLGLALAGCEGFDPTSFMDQDFFNTKKRLPGERKAVFPEGTPGVTQGVPKELVKGNQPSDQAEPTPPKAQAEAAEPKAESKPKPKPKPKVVAKPKEEPQEESRPTAVTVRPTQETQQTQPAQAQSQVQWPDPPPMQRQPAAGALPGSAQPSGGVVWPDPPAPR